MIIIITITTFFAFSRSIAVSDFFMDIHDKWKHPKCNIFCNIMQDSVLNKIIQSILHVLSFQAQCYWIDILKLHWNYTEKPLDGYTESTLKLHCTSSAPQLHLPTHPNCTSSAPQLHLQRTSNSAPPAHLKQRTSWHPNLIYIFARAPPAHLNCTSQHHNLYKSMFSA